MPQYKAPGVYVEEVERGPKSIEGVGTSTAGFLGETERGPEDPQLLTSYADYQRHYGSVVENRYLAQSVNGFFQNGGSTCYVGRVTPENTATAEGHLPLLGTTAGHLRASVETLDFGRVANDQTPTRGVEVESIEEVGDRTITITDLQITGTLSDDFEVVTDVPDDGIAIVSGETERIEVRFVHESTESSGTAPVLEITVAGEATADDVTLTGEALSGDLGASSNDGELGLSTRRLDFGSVLVGGPDEMTVTLQNLGSTDLTLGDPALSLGSDTHFTIENEGDFNNATLGSTETTDVTVTAEPHDDIELTETLTVNFNAGSEEITLTAEGILTDEVLSAEGGDPSRDGQLAAPTGPLDFGFLVGGTLRTRTLTLYNRGTVDITLTEVSEDTGPFTLEGEVVDAIRNDDPADNPTIARGSSTELTVRAHPNWTDSGGMSAGRTLGYEYTDSSGDQTNQITVMFEADVAESIIGLTAVGPGDWGTGVAVTVADGSLYEPGENNLFQATVRYWSDTEDRQEAKEVFADPRIDNDDAPDPDAEEVYDNLSTVEASSDYYAKQLNGSSTLIEVIEEESLSGQRPANGTVWFGGEFPGEAVEASDFEGEMGDNPDERTGLEAFKQIDEIAMVCVPDEHQYSSPLSQTIVDHCTNQKDRFAILQSQEQAGGPGALEPTIRSDYAAFYYPWLTIDHPETERDQVVPPGGHVAGIYARSDQEHGVHKAPANEQVRGIRELQLNISKGDQEILNPKGVNCIRTFRGRGTRVWGARTTSSDPSWKYVNVRRLFLFVEESIDEGTQWVVFEPNDEKLWARVRQTIRNFLTSVWQDGALMGTTPEEAFYVKCDRSTMTQNDIDNGRLICEIGIAPVKPAEFVVFRISQMTAGAEA